MISAIVATYGDRAVWDRLADRAVGSLDVQTLKPLEIIRTHGETLAQARNHAASLAKGDHLLFLDADDALDQLYVEAMTEALEQHAGHEVLLQPATTAWFADGTTDENPTLIPPRGPSLLSGNHMVIGTIVSRSMFLAAGGFWEEPSMEDWSFFLRAVALGAQSIPVPKAIYYVYQAEGGRNFQPPPNIYSTIVRSYQNWCAQRGLEP